MPETPPSFPSTVVPSSDRSGHRFLNAVDRVLYPITLGYTAVILGFVVYEFTQGGQFQPRFPFSDVYLTLLTAYAAQREGTKWLGAAPLPINSGSGTRLAGTPAGLDESTMRIRRGELFVGVWFAVYLAMIAIANLSSQWAMPVELKTITLGVLGIFAATGISSGIRERVKPGGGSGAPDRKALALKILGERGDMTAGEMAAALEISTTTAWRLLEGLEKEGRLTQAGSADPRERKYHLQ